MSDEIKPDKVRRGRTSRWKFTQTPQWALLMAELSDAGYRIYSVLIGHVNATDDDGEAWPQQETIGQMLDRRREAVSRVITKELGPLGLVDVEVERYGTNNSRRRNIYTVHELPPEDFTGVASISEWYAANPRPKPAPVNRRERKNAGQPGRAKNRTSGDAEDRASGGAKKRTGMTRTGNDTKGDSSSPPPPPSSTDGAASPGTAGREEETSPEHHEHLSEAQKLVSDAVKRWPKSHKAPSVRDAHRLSERVAAELAAGGDEDVILHELTRDLKEAGSAVRVILGARTKTPGWGRSSDPRPDHSRYKIPASAPWCGTCDEHTRMVQVDDPHTGKRTPGRCRAPVQDTAGQTVACNPNSTPLVNDDDQGESLPDLSAEEFTAMTELSLENPGASAQELLLQARAKVAQGAEEVHAGRKRR